MTKKITSFVAAIATALSLAPASAETVYGVTTFRELVSFESSDPGNIITNIPISGMVDSFESVVGMDFRVLNSTMYLLGNAPGSIYRLYTLNLATATATQVGGDLPGLTGTRWGFDFDPVLDRIRVVSDSNTNLRLNPDTGAIAGNDTQLNGGGTLSGAAYDRNDTDGATATTLFGISYSGTPSLVRIGGIDGTPSPNGGTVTSIGSLGISTTSIVAFDISQTGTAFAALTTGGTPIPSSIFTVNLSTGAASLLGQIGDGSFGIGSLAVIPEPTCLALLGVASLSLGLRRRRV